MTPFSFPEVLEKLNKSLLETSFSNVKLPNSMVANEWCNPSLNNSEALGDLWDKINERLVSNCFPSSKEIPVWAAKFKKSNWGFTKIWVPLCSTSNCEKTSSYPLLSQSVTV